MKNTIATFLLLVAFFIAGNAQAATDSSQHKDRNHQRHNSHNKKEGHRKGIHLFHRHGGHHGKGHSQGDTHSHSHHNRNHGVKENRSTK